MDSTFLVPCDFYISLDSVRSAGINTYKTPLASMIGKLSSSETRVICNWSQSLLLGSFDRPPLLIALTLLDFISFKKDHQHQVHNKTLHHSSTFLLIFGIKRRELSQDGKGGEEDSSCKFLLLSREASCSFSTPFGRREAILSDIRCHSRVDPSLSPWNDSIKLLILERSLRKTKSEGF